MMACLLAIASSGPADAAPTIRNGAEFPVFSVEKPKIYLKSIAVVDPPQKNDNGFPAFIPGSKVKLALTFSNLGGASVDAQLSVSVKDWYSNVIKGPEQTATFAPNQETVITVEVAMPKNCAIVGYNTVVKVLFNGIALVEYDYSWMIDFYIVRPPPLKMEPASARLNCGKTQKYTVTGGDGKITYAFNEPYSGTDPKRRGTIAADGTYTAGKIAGAMVKIYSFDEAGAMGEAWVEMTEPLDIQVGQSNLESGEKTYFWHTGGWGAQKVWELISDGSGGSFSASNRSFKAGPNAPSQAKIRVKDMQDGQVKGTADRTIYISPAPPPLGLEQATATLNPGGVFNFRTTGGRPGSAITFSMNSGAEYIGSITPSGQFTAKNIADNLQSMSVTNAIVVKSPGSPYLYAHVKVERVYVPPPPPGPLSLSPSKRQMTSFQQQTFTISGGSGQITVGAEGNSYGAVKLNGMNVIYMAGSEEGKDEIAVKDANSAAKSTIYVGQNPPDGWDIALEVTGTVAEVFDIPVVGELAELGGMIKTYAENDRRYSDFGGTVFQGPYRKGAVVTATYLNDPTKVVVGEVLDDNGRYFLRCPWVGPTRIEADGLFWDEFVGANANLPEALSAVTNGRGETLVECSLNIPTAIASEIIKDKMDSIPNNMITGSQINSTNERVGEAIGLSGGADVSKTDFGDMSDPNSAKLTNFHLAVAAEAGPSGVIPAVRQFADEISGNRNLGSTAGGIVARDSLSKQLAAIRFRDDLTAKTPGGDTVSVPLALVLARLAGDTTSTTQTSASIKSCGVLGDADGDGLSDTDEVKLGTNPFYLDTDFDGLSDGDEVNIHKTNPLLADSDRSGVKDGQELKDGTDPLDYSDDKVPGIAGNIEWKTSEGQKAATFDIGAHESTIEFPGAEAGAVTKIEVPPGYEAEIEYE